MTSTLQSKLMNHRLDVRIHGWPRHVLLHTGRGRDVHASRPSEHLAGKEQACFKSLLIAVLAFAPRWPRVRTRDLRPTDE